MTDPLALPRLREAADGDLPLLLAILVEAMNWDGLRDVTTDSVRGDPLAWHYLDGWRRTSDFGMVALIEGRPVGAVWARLLGKQDAGYGFVDESTPELTLGVVASARGRGVGRLLMEGLVGLARSRGLTRLSLSVEDGNDRARQLYETMGFEVVGRNGGSDTMLLRLQE